MKPEGSGWTLRLCVRWDVFGEGGAAAVMAAVRCGACGGLEELNLNNNKIGEGGAAAVFKVLIDLSFPLPAACAPCHA